MPFKFIDYSAVFFKTIAKEELPAERGGKFVQIINTQTGDEYLVLSPKNLSVYHANIVERFCMLNGNIQGKYNAKKDYFEIEDGSWEVVGGGIWAVNDDQKILKLEGTSQGYGKFDGTDLRAKIKAVDSMTAYDVMVDGK